MAINTCMSVIEYDNETDWALEPFFTEREQLAEQMFNQGKTATLPNGVGSDYDPPFGRRAWVDFAAAQEFLDFVIATAPTYNVTLVSTTIEALPSA